MRSILTVALCPTVASCCVVFACTIASCAEPPLPFVAVRVDYFREGPEPAFGTGPRKVGEQRGSGVIVGTESPGVWFVLTNAHVVQVGQEVARSEPRVLVDGTWRRGRVIAADDESDLALIRFRSSAALSTVEISDAEPPDVATVETHGLSSGANYCLRTTELHYALPLPSGAKAWALHRYYVKTTFRPGESGGAVTFDDQLIGLIHGNDPAAGWGLIVDHASIVQFLNANSSWKSVAR